MPSGCLWVCPSPSWNYLLEKMWRFGHLGSVKEAEAPPAPPFHGLGPTRNGFSELRGALGVFLPPSIAEVPGAWGRVRNCPGNFGSAEGEGGEEISLYIFVFGIFFFFFKRNEIKTFGAHS